VSLVCTACQAFNFFHDIKLAIVIRRYHTRNGKIKMKETNNQTRNALCIKWNEKIRLFSFPDKIIRLRKIG